SSRPSLELIRRAILFANRDVFELAESDPAYKTMATTVALIHIEGDSVTVAHVGDSRVYRLEDGHFRRETVDHTDLNDAIRAGRIGPDQIDGLPGGNVINRALGVESGVDVEIKTIRVRDGTKFLLCSDGIYRHISDDEIARVLAEHKDPQRAVDELKRIVHQRGADDNLTAVAVQIGRAKQTPILSIDDGLPTGRTKAAATSPHGEGAGFAKAKSRDGRIHVEFNRAGSAPDRDIGALEESAALRAEEADTERNARGSRILMYTLLVLVLIAGAFYGGLRASNVIKSRSEPNANREDLLKTGREAFE